MPRPLPSFLLLLPLSALLLGTGCARDAPPVARVEVGSSELLLPHGRFTTLDLSWQLEAALESGRPPTVFVHLIDAGGSVLRTFDHPWPGSWHVGSRIEYRLRLHQSALAPPLEPGIYGLTLGLYEPEDRRWPLNSRGDVMGRREYHVADVRVPGEGGSEPHFQFSPEWLDSEPGRDRQILTRRWLKGPGLLSVRGLEGAGELWLRLLVPAADGNQELVLIDGATQPGAVVTCDCGDVEARLAGAGSHDVTLPITAPGSAQGCAIQITPNFYLLEIESGDRRALSLDVLAWAPD